MKHLPVSLLLQSMPYRKEATNFLLERLSWGQQGSIRQRNREPFNAAYKEL